MKPKAIYRIPVLVLAAAVAVTLSATAAVAQDEGGTGGEDRVRQLIYRSRALDGSERVAQSGEQTTVTFSDEVLFEFDRADLKPQAQSRLDELAAELNELGPRTVAITGHTDSRGETAYNQDLSERRAESVRSALADRLSGDSSFDVIGKGETEPIAPNENEDGSDNPEGRALNRRVEVTYPQ